MKRNYLCKCAYACYYKHNMTWFQFILFYNELFLLRKKTSSLFVNLVIRKSLYSLLIRVWHSVESLETLICIIYT